MFIPVMGTKSWKKFLKEQKGEAKLFSIRTAIVMYSKEHSKAFERYKNAKTEEERLDAEYDVVLNHGYINFFSKQLEKELSKNLIKRAFRHYFNEAKKDYISKHSTK